jgi:hypothetical protein
MEGTTMLVRVILVCALMGASSAAMAQEAAKDLLNNWVPRVGEHVDLTGCTLNGAREDQIYCDAPGAGVRLYVDGPSVAPETIQKAIRQCGGPMLLPECNVAISGDLQASFGSPYLVNGVVTFLAE